MTAPTTNPLLDDPELMDRLEQIWQRDQKAKARRARERRARPEVHLWDGDWNHRGRVTTELSGAARWVGNDTGTARLAMPVDNPLSKWGIDVWGRPKQNVHLTVEKNGARWGGRLSGARLAKDVSGDRYTEFTFAHDYEELKHIAVWCNPFLPAIVQFPKSFVLAGPSIYMLKLALFLNVMRLEGNWWALPDDPLDLSQWGAGLDMSQWNIVVKPHSLLGDDSPWTILSSRFKTWHDMAAACLADGQLGVECRRYLDGDPPPWPGADLRHGTLVVDIVDHSGHWTGPTSRGGNLLTGLIRTVAELGESLIDETLQTVVGNHDPYASTPPEWIGTLPSAPWAVVRDGEISGVEAADFLFTPGTDVQMVVGGHSAPGVNETISAGVQLALNNLGTVVLQPTAGTIADIFLRPLYEDVFGAWQSQKSLQRAQRYGWSHYHESVVGGADRAYTLAAIVALRSGFHATRPRFSHQLTLADGRPFTIGQNGQGHYFLYDRLGSTIVGLPSRWQVVVEQVSEIGLEWARETGVDWSATLGDRSDHRSATETALAAARSLSSALQEMGVL
ncbi:phage tail protein [Dietzia maris]|uniref:Phage tail protein n=1 Tax=Dietzia maris TaxID=37915 RepID=A0AAE4R0G3_9ACTN|nr:phage tail protein [Dietzia maris]MDV6299948.1 phage tail protein [Dietzia maris]